MDPDDPLQLWVFRDDRDPDEDIVRVVGADFQLTLLDSRRGDGDEDLDDPYYEHRGEHTVDEDFRLAYLGSRFWKRIA